MLLVSLCGGGGFTDAGEVSGASYIAQWNGDWSKLGNSIDHVNDDVRVVTPVTGAIIVGGDFRYDAGAIANLIAVWSSNQWRSIGSATALTPEASGTVRSIFQRTSGSLYIGGVFTLSNGTYSRADLAEYDSSGGNWLGFNVTGGDGIYAIGVSTDQLYFAGDFEAIYADYRELSVSSSI